MGASRVCASGVVHTLPALVPDVPGPSQHRPSPCSPSDTGRALIPRARAFQEDEDVMYRLLSPAPSWPIPHCPDPGSNYCQDRLSLSHCLRPQLPGPSGSRGGGGGGSQAPQRHRLSRAGPWRVRGQDGGDSWNSSSLTRDAAHGPHASAPKHDRPAWFSVSLGARQAPASSCSPPAGPSLGHKPDPHLGVSRMVC